MAKTARQYICQSCGSVHKKWAGKCEGCGEWNSISEEIANDAVPKGLSGGKGRLINLAELSGTGDQLPRSKTGLPEFDRVTGGGLVAGSAILIGGAYISGEEAVDQVRLRASRLGLANANLALAAATNIRDIIATIEQSDARLLVIDSIQTMYIDNIESAPGTVSQVRACTQELIRLAKRRGIILFLVGHVTKEGQIAGPRVMEHMVDTVLYFEGDRGHQFRILRAVKNRFGPTDEIGVFEMQEQGLVEVTNPSELFLAERQVDTSGSVVFAGMEGTRPVLVEVQALVAPTAYATPRRAVIGWDQGRLAMVLAVLEARCGVQAGMNDVYLNVAGGLRITEPAADLAVAAALISSLSGQAIPADTVIFGEIGLAGEVRPVRQMDHRLKEAAKLGFEHALVPVPRTAKKTTKTNDPGIKLTKISHVRDILPLCGEG